MATTLYHGTARTDWQAHIGACLTPSEDAATSYARWRGYPAVGAVLAISIDMTGLVVQDRTEDVDRDQQDYPGDTAAGCATLAAEGLDIVTYDDEDERGQTLRCVRLVSARAVAAVVSVTSIDE